MKSKKEKIKLEEHLSTEEIDEIMEITEELPDAEMEELLDLEELDTNDDLLSKEELEAIEDVSDIPSVLDLPNIHTPVVPVQNNNEILEKNDGIVDNAIYDNKEYNMHVSMKEQKEAVLPSIKEDNQVSKLKRKEEDKKIQSSEDNVPTVLIR